MKCDNGAVYGLGVLGALVYYIQHATSVWNGIVGIIYSFFWPAFLAYKLLEFFRM